MRIVFAGFQHETNTFAQDLADDAAFAHGGGFPPFSRGEAVFQFLVPTANVPAAGFLNAARAAGDDLVPVLWTAACPSGYVARATYERIAAEVVDGIRAALPVDAVYLDLHGAMVAEHVPDGEGELLARVRAVIGPELPLIVSLDLHANVTARMVDLADALVAFRTYPHVDMAQTGARAYGVLVNRVARGRPFARAMRRISYLVPICWQATEDQPAKRLYDVVAQVERDMALPSASYTMGFPAADFPECGQVVWAYADTAEQAAAATDHLARVVEGAEAEFHGPLYVPDAMVDAALALVARGNRPVVVADAQDNPGAGGTSDTMGLIKALVARDVPMAIVGALYDPAAAKAAHAAGVGAEVTLDLGGHSGVVGDSPMQATFVVDALSTGAVHTLGRYYGELDMTFGLSACLRMGGVRIAVVSAKAQMADREMFRFLGLHPETADIVVVKSAIHFRADFGPIAGAILTAVAPGAMMMQATDWQWHHLPGDVKLMPGGPTVAQAQAPTPEHA